MKDELIMLRKKFGLIEDDLCSEEENKTFRIMEGNNKPLPEGIYRCEENNLAYCRYKNTDLTENEISELLKLYQLNYLKKINAGITFFVVLTIISVTLSIIILTLLK